MLQENNIIKYYIPPLQSIWKGREDSSYIHNHIQLCNLKNDLISPEKPSLCFLGFASDEGIRRNLGRVGACEGPSVLRESLGKLPFNRTDSISLYDAGDVFCEKEKLEKAQADLGKAVNQIILNKMHPIIIGGGHEVAFGTYLGLSEAYRNEDITIINFDAHYDLRPVVNEKSTSGTSFFQIAVDRKLKKLKFDYNCIGIQELGNSKASFETAKELHVKTLSAEKLHLQSLNESKKFIENILSTSKYIYISLCMDVFSSAFAPGVSAPQPLGVTPWQIIPLLRMLAESKKAICFEIAELSPPLDQGIKTTQLAAYLISEYIHNFKI